MSDAARLALSVQYACRGIAPDRSQCRRWVNAACTMAKQYRSCSLTLRFVDEKEQRKLNRTFRGRDYATNVLTFSYGSGNEVVADIAICVAVARREAHAQKKHPKAHFAHLVVHGTLHALGYDHENTVEARAMETLEGQILGRFRLANPYA